MMFRQTSLLALVLCTGLLGIGCGDDDPVTGPSPDEPTELVDTFSATLTPNGAVTHPFVVTRAGGVTARITALTPSDAVVGLSIGPLTGNACSQAVANDAATANTAVVGNASAGNFCVRIFDAGGTLTAPVDYELSVTHF